MGAIKIKKLTFAYDGFDPIFKDVSLTLDTSWKLALVGRNGSGKTTLFKLLLGQEDYLGQIHSDQDFAYFPQNIKDQEQLLIYSL